MAGLGTYRSLESGGAMFTRGGKNSRVVLFEVSAAEIAAFARKAKVEMSKMMHKAAGRAADGCLSQIRKVMEAGGGLYGVPRFAPYNPFTLTLHPDWKRRTIGGVLAKSESMAKWPEGTRQFVGWKDARRKGDGWRKGSSTYASLAEKFQEGRGGSSSEVMFADPEIRAQIHRNLGIKDIPREYTHTPRQVLIHYGERLDANLKQFKEGALKRMIAQHLAKAALAAKGVAA